MPTNTQSIDKLERWLVAWTNAFTTLSVVLDQIERDQSEIDTLLKVIGKRQKFGKAVGDIEWAGLYQYPTLVVLAIAGFGVGLVAPGFLRMINPARVNDLFSGNGIDLGGDVVDPEPGTWVANRAFSGYMAMSALLRSQLSFRVPISKLVKQAATDDSAFFKAIRIDPTVLTLKPFRKRLARATIEQDPEFFSRLSNALTTQIKIGDFEHERLQCALVLLQATRQLPKLNEELAYQLFIKRTHLYRAHARGDAKRSLWRYIQRWKKRHATKVSEEKSS